MSLWKIPFLLLTWASYKTVSTPPTEHARTEDQERYRNLSWSAMSLQKRDIGRVLVSCLVAGLMLSEITFAAGLWSPQPTSRTQKNDPHSSDHYNAGTISPLFIFGTSSAIAGGIIRWWSYRTMGRHFTFQLAILKDHQLITHGPYAFVRHPGYTALILNIGGLFACELSAGSWWIETHVFNSVIGKGVAVLAVVTVVQLLSVISRAPAEDRMLQEKFGQQWEEWKMRVPYMFLPGIL